MEVVPPPINLPTGGTRSVGSANGIDVAGGGCSTKAMLHPWKTTASTYLVTNEWLRLRADTCERHDGHVIAPYYVIEERDFVHALPVLSDGRIALVRQYRHAAQTYCLELPGGLLDRHESPLAGAQREAREECGLTGGH
jgi:hypothetical protein